MEMINQYINQTFVSTDQVLEDVLLSIQENGMRPISVSPASGKALTMLVSLTDAKNVLEIGALGGYSGICLARGLTKEGHLTSMELEESFAKLANSNLTKAGFGEQVTYKTGPALDSLEALKAEGKTFDFFFIDADKENYRNYLDRCLELAEPNAVIVADNVLAGGTVADASIQGKHFTDNMREFNEYTARHPRLTSVLLPIGDGLTISQVKRLRS